MPSDGQGNQADGPLGWSPSPLPLAEDGGMQPGAFQAQAGGEAPPPWDEEHCICLRGPCRYFFETTQHFEHGNAPGTLEHQPREFDRRCTAVPGVDLGLTADSPILSCNWWDPGDPSEAAALEARRRTYHERRDRDLGVSAGPDLDPEADHGLARDVRRALSAERTPPAPPPFPSELSPILSAWPAGQDESGEATSWEWQADLGYEVSVDGCESPWEALSLALQKAKELHDDAAGHADST